jgi:hypothetical protein
LYFYANVNAISFVTRRSLSIFIFDFISLQGNEIRIFFWEIFISGTLLAYCSSFTRNDKTGFVVSYGYENLILNFEYGESNEKDMDSKNDGVCNGVCIEFVRNGSG